MYTEAEFLFLPYRLQNRCRYRGSSASAVTRGRKVTRGETDVGL